jgi:hypothetical protein
MNVCRLLQALIGYHVRRVKRKQNALELEISSEFRVRSTVVETCDVSNFDGSEVDLLLA